MLVMGTFELGIETLDKPVERRLPRLARAVAPNRICHSWAFVAQSNFGNFTHHSPRPLCPKRFWPHTQKGSDSQRIRETPAQPFSARTSIA